jgi:CRP/FNR family cyclic AMP-dependent transcriptional regulator
MEKKADFKENPESLIGKRVWNTLIQSGFEKTFGVGAVIYAKDDPSLGLFCLINGKVKISTVLADGTESILNIIGAPAIFGEASAFSGRRISSAITLTKSCVVHIPEEKSKEILVQHPEIAFMLIKTLSQKLKCLALRTEDLSSYDTAHRLARLMLNYQDYGVFMLGNDASAIHLSHEELASLVGTTRSNVTIILNEFAKKGLVELSRRKIIIKDLAALHKYANFEDSI